MTVSIDDLTTPVTADEAKTSIYTGLSTVGTNTTSWKPGSVVRTLIAIIAVMYSACTQLIAEVAKSAFLELAFGAWLTLVARYRYGITRQEPTFAQAKALTLVNTSGNVYDLDPGDLIVRNPDTDKTYTNVAFVSVGAGATVTLVEIVAQEAGSASTSGVGRIVELVTAFPGMTCTNTLALVGLDQEEDSPLKQRCRDQLGARSANGPSDAHAAIGRSARRADGTLIGINRLRIRKDGKGNGYFYLATPGGGVAGAVDDLTSDLGIVNEQIQRYAAPLGFTAHSLSATPRVFDIVCQVYVLDTSGRTAAQITTLVEKALGAYLGAAPLGGFVIDGQPGRIYLDDLKGVIKSALPEIFHVVVSSHVADVDMAYADASALGSLACTVSVQQQRVI